MSNSIQSGYHKSQVVPIKLNSAGKLRYRHYRITDGESVKVNELDDVLTIVLK